MQSLGHVVVVVVVVVKINDTATVFDRFQGQGGRGAWPYDAYNHADSSWKIPGNTATVILNFC